MVDRQLKIERTRETITVSGDDVSLSSDDIDHLLAELPDPPTPPGRPADKHL